MKKKLIIIFSLLFVLVVASFIWYCNSNYYIRLVGSKEITLNLGDNYSESGAKTLFNSKIKIEGNVDNTKVGAYKIKYSYNKNYQTRLVNVVDNVEPVITLNGLDRINVLVNGQYIEQGATASDNYDGDLTDKIVITNNLDITQVGEYSITYEVRDSSNNYAKLDRIINVTDTDVLTLPIAEFSLDGYFESTILKETEDMGQEYINDTIFYGDSITFNFFYYGNVARSNVWAMSNLTPENAHFWKVPFYKYGEELTLVDGLAKYKPKRVIITLGANAIGITTKDFFISEYESLIEEAKAASPDTTIIVQSAFPVDDRYIYTGLNNAKINMFNYYLAEMCERQGIYFLNTAEALKNSDGFMNKSYCYASDGIHLYDSGNEVVMNYVRRHGVI